MAKSVETSSQFKLLPKQIQDLINQDQMDDPTDAPTFAFAPNRPDTPSIKMATQGAMFKDDVASYPSTVGPLTKADLLPAEVAQAAPIGALSVAAPAMPRREPVDFAAMLQKFVPQDDSSSKYLAMASALGKPTGFGSFGEKMANVADALLEQKQNQEKLRAQYTPLIMQHVAAQQAREEQAAYRLEAQQQAHVAQQQAVALAAQNRLDLAAQNQAAMDERARENRVAAEERAKADRTLREALANNGRTEANKPPSGYAWGPVGPDGMPTLQVVKGGPADAKTEAKNALKLAGETDVNSAVATLRDAYNRLETGGGITNTDADGMSNLGAAISSSAVGQSVGKMFGTQNQSARNDIAMTRPALLASLMKATGMSAKQLDSNVELKLWMATATDPTLDVQANRRALDAIERKYLSGSAPSGPASPPPGLPSADALAAERARRNALKGQ